MPARRRTRLLFVLYLFVVSVHGQLKETSKFDYTSSSDSEHYDGQFVYKYVDDHRLRHTRDLNLVDKMLQNEPPDHLTTPPTTSIFDSSMEVTNSTKTTTTAASTTVHRIIDLCTYSHINARVNECFQANTNCSIILDCINSMNLVEVCNQSAMYTPTIWILNVYEILQNLRFCSTSTSQCSSHENQYLIKLDEVMRTLYIYGSSFLDKPKEDSKQYCAKADHLVTEVKDLFDIYDYCFDPQSMNEIKSSIDELADNILDRDCRYCISSNIFFENCIYGEKFYHFSNFLCNDSVKCIYDKIEFNNCEKDNETPLKLITMLIKNLTDICEYDESVTTSSEVVKEWLMTVDSCVKERSYIGLEMSEAPQHVDYCNEIDQTSQCLRGNIHMILRVKPGYKEKFLWFFHQFERLQLACDATTQRRNKTRPIEIRLPDGLRDELSDSTIVTTTPAAHSEQLIMEDKKNYYEGKIVKSSFKWIDIDSMDFLRHGPIKDIEFSHNYLKATIVKLKFKFPFYGHSLDKVIIATGGFLYVGSLLNPLITKAQYIAPLMANFDPNLNANRSSIIYVDNSTHFICTWERLMLRDQIDNGEYTFQVILNKDGQISFNYKRIPNTRISSLNHEVKVGLSDAYTFYKLLSFSKIEYTIVQYNVVNIPLESLQDNSSIHFMMLPNCIQLKTCDTCIKGVGSFKCLWCPILNRCSDTLDRYRQEWLEHSCPTEIKLQTNAVCSIQNMSFNFDMRFGVEDSDPDYVKNVFVGIMMTILLSMGLTIFGWVVYAYKNPNSPSGMWLIDHRPRKLLDLISTRLSSINNNKEVPSMTRLEEQNA